MKNKTVKKNRRRRNKKRIKVSGVLFSVVIVFLLGFILLYSNNNGYVNLKNTDEAIILYPWDIEGKSTNEYTWEEYESLSDEEKEAFKGTFLSEEDFETWKMIANGVENSVPKLYPWDIEGKSTNEYSWEEYESLSNEEKKAFKDTFLSEEDFEVWKTISQAE